MNEWMNDYFVAKLRVKISRAGVLNILKKPYPLVQAPHVSYTIT